MTKYDLSLGRGVGIVNCRLKMALRNGTKRGIFKNLCRGAKGANGSFKLASQVLEEDDPLEEAEFL